MCAFCTEFAQPVEDTNIITERDGWVMLPSIGAFTPGYCLVMPRRHIDATADAPSTELGRVEEFVERMRRTIATAFSMPVILAEHGPRGCDIGAGCCSHAHLHLIPVPDTAPISNAYAAIAGPGAQLETLAELTVFVSGSYVYLSTRTGEHRLWSSAGFPRQHVRRVGAREHGHPHAWDWRDHPFEANRRATYSTLTRLLAPANANGGGR